MNLDLFWVGLTRVRLDRIGFRYLGLVSFGRSGCLCIRLDCFPLDRFSIRFGWHGLGWLALVRVGLNRFRFVSQICLDWFLLDRFGLASDSFR